MGFDAIWISPVVKNSGSGYHGQWATDFQSINEHFGTSGDLKELVQAAHKLDVWVMLDIVANHVAPIGTDYSQIKTFSSSEHQHTPCSINDYCGKGDQQNVEQCRLANLPDLNQDNSFVKKTLVDWINFMVTTYQFDGIRIDTLPFVSKDFWKEFVGSAAVFQIGEVFCGNTN